MSKNNRMQYLGLSAFRSAKKKRVTIKVLTEAIRVSFEEYQELERGKRKFTIEQLKTISRVFGFKEDDFEGFVYTFINPDNIE